VLADKPRRARRSLPHAADPPGRNRLSVPSYVSRYRAATSPQSFSDAAIARTVRAYARVRQHDRRARASDTDLMSRIRESCFTVTHGPIAAATSARGIPKSKGMIG